MEGLVCGLIFFLFIFHLHKKSDLWQFVKVKTPSFTYLSQFPQHLLCIHV